MSLYPAQDMEFIMNGTRSGWVTTPTASSRSSKVPKCYQASNKGGHHQRHRFWSMSPNAPCMAAQEQEKQNPPYGDLASHERAAATGSSRAAWLPREYLALDRFFAGCRLGEAVEATKGLVSSQRRKVRSVADYDSDT